MQLTKNVADKYRNSGLNESKSIRNHADCQTGLWISP